MTDTTLAVVFLGVIALAMVVSATVQVVAAFAAMRAARRLSEVMSSLERDVRPIVSNLQTLSADAARATALAAAQVNRADQLITTLSKRVDETAATLQEIVLQPARDGLAVLQGVKAVIAAFREPKDAERQPPD